MEVRGIFYRALKQVFPHIGEIVGEGLGKHFQDVDGAGWYDAAPYLATVEYLRDRISPQVMVLIGNQLVETIREYMQDFDVASPAELAEKLPELYRNFVRGEGAGDWRLQEFTAGRAVIRETGITSNVDISVGVIKSALEAAGAYNVRVAVIDDRAQGGDANRYLAEWLEPDAD
jgi:hypothetical protein